MLRYNDVDENTILKITLADSQKMRMSEHQHWSHGRTVDWSYTRRQERLHFEASN